MYLLSIYIYTKSSELVCFPWQLIQWFNDVFHSDLRDRLLEESVLFCI